MTNAFLRFREKFIQASRGIVRGRWSRLETPRPCSGEYAVVRTASMAETFPAIAMGFLVAIRTVR